jgi:hypothetical protein
MFQVADAHRLPFIALPMGFTVMLGSVAAGKIDLNQKAANRRFCIGRFPSTRPNLTHNLARL